MSGWLAYHSRRSQPAGTNEAVGQEGTRKIELHLFNLYFLSSPPPAHPGSHNPHTHTLPLCLCCFTPSLLQAGHTSRVRLRLKQGPLGVVVVSGWLSEHSCVGVCVLVVMFINSTANRCIGPCPLWGTDNWLVSLMEEVVVYAASCHASASTPDIDR